MASADELLVRSYARALDSLLQLYDEDKLDECMNQCQELLKDENLPHYYRIRVLALFGSTTGDWYDAEALRKKAESL